MGKYISFLPILLLPLGCIGLTSGFQVIALLIFIYLYFIKKQNFDCNAYFKNKIIKISLFYFFIWIIGIGISDFVVNNNIKECLNVLQRIIPFILAGFFVIKSNNYFKYAWIGICASMLIISCDVIYNLFIQGHWRPITMFNNPNRLGGFLILLLPFVYAGFIEYKVNIEMKVLGIVTTLLGIISLIISGSRGAIIGIIVGTLISIFIVKYKQCNLKKVLFCTFQFFALLTAFIFIIHFLFPQMVTRSYDMERVYLWISSINIFLDYPIFGIGKGNFNEFYINGYINPLAENPKLASPHNIFLQFMVERGIVATLPFVVLLGIQIYILIRNLFKENGDVNFWVISGLIVIFGMIIHGMFDTVMNNRTYQLMYWFLYAISCFSIITYNNFDKKETV